tara:strand:+ start:396 stop:2786 length:2391 start_codon:yes stop_codon:yes gene_type:complete
MGDLIDLLGQILIGACVAFFYILGALFVIGLIYHLILMVFKWTKGLWDLLVDLIGSFFGKSQGKTDENKPSPVEYITPFTGKKEQDFKNGVYYGDYVNGLRTGKGIYSFKNGNIYEGDFKTGLITGKGVFKWKDGDIYEGDFVNGERTGKGVYKFKSGNVYEGDWVDGEKTGKGVFKWKNGDIYEGDWVDGERTGKGVFKWKDGDIYEGDFVNGERTGKGVYKFKNGNIYEGDFADDKRTGKGILKWKDGDIYEGDFVDGEKAGKGAFSYKNGNSCGGDWVDNMMTGKGWFRWVNGNTYTGDFDMGYIDGEGFFKWSSGEIYTGVFEVDTLVEFGKTLDVEAGNFENGWKYNPRTTEEINETVNVEKEVLKEVLFEINRVYRKTDVYKILNVPKGQRGGKWRNGYCEHNKDFFIFANIGIPGKTDVGVFDYKNKISGDKMEWEAQNGSKLSWPTVQKLINSNPYIFVRYKDFRSGAYKFIGVGECVETRDTTPVYFKWRICGYQKTTIKTPQKPLKTESVLKQNQKRIEKYGSDEVVKKPKEKKTVTIKKKTGGAKKPSRKKGKVLDNENLKKIFNSFVKNNFNIYGVGENPFKIRYIHGKSSKGYSWVFLKNISSAYFDSRPDVSRIQVGDKPELEEIRKKNEMCIPVGYDSENKTFVVWNPDGFLKRVSGTKNISLYGSFSEQSNLKDNFKKFELPQGEGVYVVKASFLSIFLKNIKTYFEIPNLTKQLSNVNPRSPLNGVLNAKDQEVVNGFLKAGKSGQLDAFKILADKNPNLNIMEVKSLLEKQKSFLTLS